MTTGGAADAEADSEALAETEPLGAALAETEPLALGRVASNTP
jgi:hypothetical protein